MERKTGVYDGAETVSLAVMTLLVIENARTVRYIQRESDVHIMITQPVGGVSEHARVINRSLDRFLH